MAQSKSSKWYNKQRTHIVRSSKVCVCYGSGSTNLPVHSYLSFTKIILFCSRVYTYTQSSMIAPFVIYNVRWAVCEHYPTSHGRKNPILWSVVEKLNVKRNLLAQHAWRAICDNWCDTVYKLKYLAYFLFLFTVLLQDSIKDTLHTFVDLKVALQQTNFNPIFRVRSWLTVSPNRWFNSRTDLCHLQKKWRDKRNDSIWWHCVDLWKAHLQCFSVAFSR